MVSLSIACNVTRTPTIRSVTWNITHLLHSSTPLRMPTFPRTLLSCAYQRARRVTPKLSGCSKNSRSYDRKLYLVGESSRNTRNGYPSALLLQQPVHR